MNLLNWQWMKLCALLSVPSSPPFSSHPKPKPVFLTSLVTTSGVFKNRVPTPEPFFFFLHQHWTIFGYVFMSYGCFAFMIASNVALGVWLQHLMSQHREMTATFYYNLQFKKKACVHTVFFFPLGKKCWDIAACAKKRTYKDYYCSYSIVSMTTHHHCNCSCEIH